jgi:hypothetical protein
MSVVTQIGSANGQRQPLSIVIACLRDAQE